MVKYHIVKRKGHEEHFDERKVYKSCYAACLSAHVARKDADVICKKATKEITQWIKTRKEVTTHQISKEIIRVLKRHDKNAAFMYETHRDVS